ncbi:SMP-30/gluconolactonase/LRE family protein [Paraburkholderia caballeronis]|uniref:Sugar lactone lactonase YvrE n=1 Tax=Paraburkholderia caballeronis TaxID=416943 RepID=A0A1H7P6K6_9BURK|nr:L-dopachrome tautomerase-related protein [Paraburkholderia caballeronis]PXW25365.1 sugar lactone lactonase YvrE [Paraburkholderia caballeronis]PXX00972.1 sugar lactone lactonase YvrE [Paraburkholderia caballeronis]RAJ99675.1 sugar lactone lactonase YvrE [Paraburkholderia caballeronis]SEE40322.1 Sugar lactone lactonase YvrE [Paraburkholderia caballeronis]SEL31239.1 Sugar lactone lactonase YvrE [Paraburkholderia caballeronis]
MPDSHFNASGSPARFARRARTLAFALAAMASAASSFAAQGNAAPLAAERAYGALETVATFDGPMPTGVTVTETGRIFVNFPRWGDDVPFTVGELRDGKVVPYPDAAVNRADDRHPADHFLSVQSVVADGQGRVWVLDTAAPNFSSPVEGGAKLVAIDLKTNRIVKTVVFPANVMRAQTYVDDVRFDFRLGRAGVAYVTDSSLSGVGGIIVIDLDTGSAMRRLTGDPSTSADTSFVPVVEGDALMQRDAKGNTKPFVVASDGIALSPDGKTLYYCPLSSRHLYAVPTALLRDASVSEPQLAAAVKDLGEKGASDGLESDANGAVYAGDYEHDSIRRLAPHGGWTTIVHDPRVLWPDTLSVGPDGYLYFTANQLHRQPGFHGGKDLRRKPYALFRVRIDAPPAPTR